MNRYGKLPELIGNIKVNCKEMMFYQYMPIKMSGYRSLALYYDDRLNCFNPIIKIIVEDFMNVFGHQKLVDSYVYITAKRGYQVPGTSFNRLGYHSDGFLTDDINYTWCDSYPTVFNDGEFKLTPHDILSLGEMEEQAKNGREVTYPDNSIMRLDQYCIHRVGDVKEGGMRTFLKLSFSKDRYDLEGNAHNYKLDYDWEMKPRKTERNIPQTNLEQ